MLTTRTHNNHNYNNNSPAVPTTTTTTRHSSSSSRSHKKSVPRRVQLRWLVQSLEQILTNDESNTNTINNNYTFIENQTNQFTMINIDSAGSASPVTAVVIPTLGAVNG